MSTRHTALWWALAAFPIIATASASRASDIPPPLPTDSALDARPEDLPTPEAPPETPPATPTPVQPPARIVPVDRPADPPVTDNLLLLPKPFQPSFEIAFSPEVQWFAAARMGRLSSADNTASLALRLTWYLRDDLGLVAGWRGLPTYSIDAPGYTAESTAWGPLIGVRWHYAFNGWLRFVTELDLELMHGETTFSAGGFSDTDGSLAFGAIPRIGLGVQLPVGTAVALEIRALVGYALRTSHTLSNLRLDLPTDGTVAPLDLGTSNHSGPVLAITFGLSF